jgi:hypothetical protein
MDGIRTPPHAAHPTATARASGLNERIKMTFCDNRVII